MDEDPEQKDAGLCRAVQGCEGNKLRAFGKILTGCILVLQGFLLTQKGMDDWTVSNLDRIACIVSKRMDNYFVSIFQSDSLLSVVRVAEQICLVN